MAAFVALAVPISAEAGALAVAVLTVVIGGELFPKADVVVANGFALFAAALKGYVATLQKGFAVALVTAFAAKGFVASGAFT